MVNTGGLGDVMGALPKALAKRGHRVMVVVPRYADYEGVADTGVRHKINMFGSMQEVRGVACSPACRALATLRMCPGWTDDIL